MKSNLCVYPAIFSYSKENNTEYYEIEFIDFNCVTFGCSLEEAFDMAQDAMGAVLINMKELPTSTTSFENIKLKNNQFINFITLDLVEYRKKNNNKSIKKTLTIPEWLNILAESENINFSQTLQDALKEKLDIE